LTGYQANSATQPPGALLGIRIAIGPIPGLFMLGGIFFALKYPMTRKVYLQITQELAVRRGANKQAS
jgi:GPH family glycoside/pentoside/hexuronide:cation symporter